MINWGALSARMVQDELHTDANAGLTEEEAAKRLELYGPNALAEEPPHGFLGMLAGQFKDFLVMILIASTVIAALMGELLDAAVILGIVILNAVLGVIQEGKAERSLAALRKMTVPEATVIRGGRRSRLSTQNLVPGDLVLIQAGDIIPADLRLLETVNLKVDESPLTGESAPVEKDAGLLSAPDAVVGDQPGLAYSGTTAVYGRGRGIVVRTGMKTEIGKIAALVASVDREETPLQRKLTQFGKYLGLACLAICLIVFILGILRGVQPFDMFMTAVSLAVAAIPEGLPAMVTIVLAFGVQRMITRRAIIRRLTAVETLGCATFVCSDKTGTLTENKMTVTSVYLPRNEEFAVSGQGYLPRGEFTRANGEVVAADGDPDLRLLLEACLACNDARLLQEDQEDPVALGDPTEAAMVVLAAKGGLERTELEARMPRIREIPFDASRKRMTTVHDRAGGFPAFTKGAPDLLLSDCNRRMLDGVERPLEEKEKEEYIRQVRQFGMSGLRVIGLAYRSLPDLSSRDQWDRDLCFLGLVSMRDPVRKDARDAVATCLEAGIRPIMVTGDFSQTAGAIARELGLAETEVITGSEIEHMSQEELGTALKRASVFARVSPEHKLRIVDVLRNRGEVVAMTGDGVNDAPALRSADIGVAMGKGGTEVAKGASDMILADDNFATIVAAIEEGRVIFENIRKAIIYLLSCNIGELLLFFLAILAGLPRPLVPVQILLINLVTDGLPALALGVEPMERGMMRLPPRDPREGLISRPIMVRLLMVGMLIALSALIPFILFRGESIALARTVSFTTLALAELWRALSNRSERTHWWNLPFLSNPQLIMAILSSAAVIMATLYLPALAHTFDMVGPTPAVWGLIATFSLFPMLGAELAKLVFKDDNRHRPHRDRGKKSKISQA